MYTHKNQALSSSHCCSTKATSIKYSECVSIALIIRHAKRVRRIILSSLVSLSLPHFSTISHKRRDFRGGGDKNKKKMLLNIKCVFWFCLQISPATFLILKTNDTLSWMCIGFHVKCPLFLPDFTDSWIFSTYSGENTWTKNLMKIRPAEAELFNAERRTDGLTDGETWRS